MKFLYSPQQPFFIYKLPLRATNRGELWFSKNKLKVLFLQRTRIRQKNQHVWLAFGYCLKHENIDLTPFNKLHKLRNYVIDVTCLPNGH